MSLNLSSANLDGQSLQHMTYKDNKPDEYLDLLKRAFKIVSADLKQKLKIHSFANGEVAILTRAYELVSVNYILDGKHRSQHYFEHRSQLYFDSPYELLMTLLHKDTTINFGFNQYSFSKKFGTSIEELKIYLDLNS